MATELGDIESAVKAAVEALALAIDGRVLPVIETKSPRFRTGLEPPEHIAISKSEREERVTRWSFTSNRTDYFVAVTVTSPFRGPDRDLSTYRAIRQEILDAFDRPPLTNAPNVFDLRAEPAEYLPAEGQEQQWDYQGVVITASVVRER